MNVRNPNVNSDHRDPQLEYILDMMIQLADMAGGIGEGELEGLLHSTVDMRRECEPPAAHSQARRPTG